MAKNDTTATVYSVELGNFGRERRRGKGKTIEIVFRSDGKKVGQMEISKSMVRWYGPYEPKPIKVRVENMDKLFKKAGELEFRR
jgi:hypothetical protein